MAIDAKKIQNNDELIAKFYTIRAGLSVIADETQKIKVSEKELSDLKIKNDKNNSDINERKNNTIYKLTYSINQQKLLIEELDKNIEKSKSHKAGMSKFWIPVLITCFAYLMILSFMLALDLNSEGFISEEKYIFIGTSIYAVPILVGIFYRKSATKKEQAKLIEGYLAGKNQAKHMIQELEKELAVVQNKVDPMYDRYADEIMEKESRFNNCIIPSATTTIKSVKEAMSSLSDGVIIEDDWKNVDLLIYYLSSGRADSLQLALQQVDQQRQTDQIVKAINEASSYIANSVEVNFRKMGSLLQGGFNMLSDQIQVNHVEMKHSLASSVTNMERAIADSTRQMRSEMNSINSSVREYEKTVASGDEVKAAFLNKINCSSEALVSELKDSKKYWLN